jgi:23S rRNA (guanosine2251-2'-O)-methyltransferase
MNQFNKNEKSTYDNLIYGRHPIIEAFDAGRTLDVIYTQKDLKSEILEEIRIKAKQFNVPIKAVPKEKLDYLTYRANHQGVAAFISQIKYAEKEEILEQVLAKGKVPLFLILDSITDVRNFGAIARTALGTGVQAIIIPKRNSAQVNSDAMKTSAGALNKIAVCREDDLIQSVKWCKANGIQVLVSDLKANKNVGALDFTKPTAIVVGEEAEGVNKLIINRADETFIIPILPAMDSYNVSVAAGIILYEAMKSRL